MFVVRPCGRESGVMTPRSPPVFKVGGERNWLRHPSVYTENDSVTRWMHGSVKIIPTDSGFLCFVQKKGSAVQFFAGYQFRIFCCPVSVGKI